AQRVQVVGQENGRRLGEPEDASLARDVLERHHQDARGWLRLRGRGNRGDGGNGNTRRNGDTEKTESNRSLRLIRVHDAFPLPIATCTRQVGSPLPRHATTSVRALTSKSESRRVNAAA